MYRVAKRGNPTATPALKTAFLSAKQHPRNAERLIYNIANERGQQYTGEGFKCNWRTLMNKALENGEINERFTFHDLRAKAGSGAEDNEQKTFRLSERYDSKKGT
jgi:hypothetical protein